MVGLADRLAVAWRSMPACGPFAEVALATGFALWLAGALGQPPGFAGVQPSPLWLLILWGGLRGGLLPALFGALLAVVVHGLGVLATSGHRLEALLAAETTWTWFAFVAIAWLVGQVRDTLWHDLQAARTTRDELAGVVQEQAVDRDVLTTANRELKRRVFDRSLELDSLVATIAASELDADERLFDAPLQMLVDYCGATRCSALLVLADGSLDLAGHRGWTLGEIRPRVQAAARSQRVQEAVRAARPGVAFTAEAVDELGPVWIAPIADASGVIKALLCIDEILPARCDEATTQAFLAIADWFTANLRRVQLQEVARASAQQLLEGLDKQKELGSPAELAERLHLEDSRRQRYTIETSVLALRCRDPRRLAPAALVAMEQQLLEVLANVVRGTDDVFRFGFPGCYVLVLTGCKPGDIEQLETRLRERFVAQSDGGLAALELRPFVPGRDAAHLAGLLPLLQQHFTDGAAMPLAQRCPVPTPRAQRRGDARDFVRRLGLELELARRFSAEVHLIEFADPAAARAVGPMIARHLWNAVGSLLRITDGIYVLGPERCVVLLPFTTCLDASRIQERLRESLARTLPAEVFAAVEGRFLSLSDTDVRQTLLYLLPAASEANVLPAATAAVGRTPAGPPRSGPVLTEPELQELAFTMTEFEGMQRVHANLANEFEVLRASGVETALPSPEAIRQRWEEVFEGRHPAEVLQAPTAATPVATPVAAPASAEPAAHQAVPTAAGRAAPAAVAPAVDATMAAAVELVVGAVVRAVASAGFAASAPAAGAVPNPATTAEPAGDALQGSATKLAVLVERLRRQCLQLQERRDGGGR